MSTRTARLVLVFLTATLLSFLGIAVGPADAWHAEGLVFCDANGDGAVSAGDIGLGNVGLALQGETCSYSSTTLTRDEQDVPYGYEIGSFYFTLPAQVCRYSESLLEATVPYADWWYVLPPSGVRTVDITGVWPGTQDYAEWLIDSPDCHPAQGAACWLTAGGVKFSQALDVYLDEYKPRNSPLHSWGGNVNPACAPVKGHWNHIAHKLNLHFQATDIQVLRCGNVPGIEPGSESPVTPVNFIEFTGPATLKGVNGNKVDYGAVCYFARAEDRNEPGSNGAKDGSYVDRYFLHVFDCATQQTLLLVDIDGDSASVDPLTITGGNMQMHYKPCEN